MIYKSIKKCLFILLWKRKRSSKTIDYTELPFYSGVHINNKHKKHYVTKTTKLSLSLVYLSGFRRITKKQTGMMDFGQMYL